MFKCEIADEILRKEVKALQLNERISVPFGKEQSSLMQYSGSHHCSSRVRCRQGYGHLGFIVESKGFNSLIGCFACLIWYNLWINHREVKRGKNRLEDD